MRTAVPRRLLLIKWRDQRMQESTDTYTSYAKRVAAETETEETALFRKEKDRMKTNDVQIEIEKGKKEKKERR